MVVLKTFETLQTTALETLGGDSNSILRDAFGKQAREEQVGLGVSSGKVV
jgi:hypothetical protein